MEEDLESNRSPTRSPSSSQHPRYTIFGIQNAWCPRDPTQPETPSKPYPCDNLWKTTFHLHPRKTDVRQGSPAPSEMLSWSLPQIRATGSGFEGRGRLSMQDGRSSTPVSEQKQRHMHASFILPNNHVGSVIDQRWASFSRRMSGQIPIHLPMTKSARLLFLGSRNIHRSAKRHNRGAVNSGLIDLGSNPPYGHTTKASNVPNLVRRNSSDSEPSPVITGIIA